MNEASVNIAKQFVVSHEMNHAIGLYDFNETTLATTDYNSQRYSVMSYNQAKPGSYFDELQLYDIASLQSMYGRNALDAGDTLHNNFGSEGNARYFSIWDSGGTDTIDAFLQTNGVLVDLRPGHFSSIDSEDDVAWSFSEGTPAVDLEGSQNVSIAFGTYIENAMGSNHADVLIGNRLSNVIYGNGGDDLIYADGADSVHEGGAGDYRQISNTVTGGIEAAPLAVQAYATDATLQNDEIHGGDGNDVIYGGAGQDTIYGGAGNDRIYIGDGDIADGGAGDDMFFLEGGSAEYTLNNLDSGDSIYVDGILYEGSEITATARLATYEYEGVEYPATSEYGQIWIFDIESNSRFVQSYSESEFVYSATLEDVNHTGSKPYMDLFLWEMDENGQQTNDARIQISDGSANSITINLPNFNYGSAGLSYNYYNERYHSEPDYSHSFDVAYGYDPTAYYYNPSQSAYMQQFMYDYSWA
jgi:RTX toxins and related Ca2+-binding proteins